MSIPMQGSWTINVKSKEAAFLQRFVINGSKNADKIYDGVEGAPSIFVTGALWTITIEHSSDKGKSWKPSAERIGNPSKSDGQIRFDILSNDSGGDLDYNDLILTCSIPESDAEFVLFGNVSTYSGLCRFNPCHPWFVVDTSAQLKELIRFPSFREAVSKLYPERVREVERPFVLPVPIPDPRSESFRPMMIPLLSINEESQVATSMLSPSEERLSIRNLAKLKDQLLRKCQIKRQPGLLLRFMEYDRTADELVGGPYSGAGNRQDLGLTVSDEQGNYIFRFTRTIDEIAQEFEDVPKGGILATELRPDIIVQVVGGLVPGNALFESALYENVSNTKRINLCFPESAINLGPSACQGGRAIQSIGKVYTVGAWNTLDAAGRITAKHPSGPKITSGAWVGTLDMYACFLDRPEVAFYTIRYRKPGGDWGLNFVRETYTYIFKPALGDMLDIKHVVGPIPRTMIIDGKSNQDVPAYTNIESNDQWLAAQRLRKISLSSDNYASILYPDKRAGTVEFRIEGYDKTGNKVAPADDTIALFIDNRSIFGDIDNISMGSVSPGECGLFDLTSPNAQLTVRFKVDHPGGFLERYRLTVKYGSGKSRDVSDKSSIKQPLDVAYDEAIHGDSFFGTFNAVAPDGDNYVIANLTPDTAWLPAGKNFCAFAFEVSATPRVTDGYSLAPERRLDVELIGIRYNL
jgi:hypothetical protein